MTRLKKISGRLAEKIRELENLKKRILALPPEKALNRILEEKDALPLVHSISRQDFYILIHEIGGEDSLPLLSMASYQQLDFIFDMEIWEKDRFDTDAAQKWLDLFMNADPTKFIKWIFHEEGPGSKIAMIEFILKKGIEVIIRVHDQDPSDFGEGFFTFDDVFYIRLMPGFYDENYLKPEKDFFVRFLTILKDYDYLTFRNLMFSHSSVIIAEQEEEMLRMKNLRLVEEGFMPFEEAIGLYQPISYERLKKYGRKRLLYEKDFDTILRLPVPITMEGHLGYDCLFTVALKSIKSDSLLRELQIEFSSLCNSIISADGKKVKTKSDLKNRVAKAAGYLSIGLERLGKINPEEERAKGKGYYADAITKHTFPDIFRFGYAPVIKLKNKIESWITRSWFLAKGFDISFWDEEWAGFLGGLLLTRPLYFDNYKTGILYREFSFLKEIVEVENIAAGIMAADELLNSLGIKQKNIPDKETVNTFITYKNFILTLWAKALLKLEYRESVSITGEEAKILFKRLFTGKKDNGPFIKIKESEKEDFFKWIFEKAGSADYFLDKNHGEVFESLFSELEKEYGPVDHKYLESKYINHFLISEAPCSLY